MLRITKWVAPVAALGLLLAFSLAVQAADQKADTGTVSGTITDQDGKAVAGVKVELFQPPHMNTHNNAKPEADNADTDKDKAANANHPKHEHPKPLFQATTDKDGKFAISDVPVGHYVAAAHLKGVGGAHERITVKSGQTTTLNLKLAPPKHHHKPAAE
jgi:hypothetical protein